MSEPEGAPPAPLATTNAEPAARRLRIPAGLTATLVAGVGGFGAIGTIALLGYVSATPLIIAPFGASCVLLFSLPGSPLARPRNVVGGHVFSALAGLAVMAILGPTPFAMAVGVGCAIIVMRVTGTTHPPAGANPIVVMLAHVPWYFFLEPVALGAIVLVICAAVYHRFVSGETYALK